MLRSDSEDIRVLMVDTHRLFLTGLSALIEKESGLTVVGQAASRREALDAARLRPDVILLELVIGNENSSDFLPDLLRIAEPGRVLILTAVNDFELHLQAVRLGAMGIVMKTESSTLLFKAIRKVHSGEAWLNRSIMAAVITGIHENRPEKPRAQAVRIATLTERELEVITLVGEGRRNKQIAERLFISEATVRHHLTSIFEKLEVGDRLELMIYAYQHGLAKVPAQTA